MRIATRLLTVAAFVLAFAAVARAQTARSVTFQLNAAPILENCLADSTEHPFQIRGEFTSWGDNPVTLTDPDGDMVYTATFELDQDSTYQYKFYVEGFGNAWESIDNRTYTVTADSSQTVPVALYDNKTADQYTSACGAEERCVEIEFRVDLSAQILAGNFDPNAGDVVTVAGGDLNGWNNKADTLQQDFFNPEQYFKIIRIEGITNPQVAPIEYKFVILPGDQSGDQWEGVANRQLTLPAVLEDADADGCFEYAFAETPFFNDVTQADLLTQATTISLEVDARPAFYFLADSSFVPSDVQSTEEVLDFSNVFINGPLVGGWDSWGPDNLGLQEDQKLFDDGTHGDLVAGDSIFTFQLELAAGQPRKQVFKFGLDGYDNENGVGADHAVTLEDAAEQRHRRIFGAALLADSSYRVDLYTPYIYITETEEGQVATVVRRGGGSGNPVSVEPTGELPTRLALQQNYPNPFNPATAFEYSLTATEHVRVRVFDLTGRLIATLVDEVQSASTYRVRFDGAGLASGVYLYQLQTPSQTITRQMVLLK